MQGQKAISGGEGGIILTNNDIYHQRMIELSHPGHSLNNHFKQFTGMSKNIKLRMHPLAAVIALADLKNIDKKNEKLKNKIIKIYEFLSKKNNILINNYEINETGGYHYGIPLFLKR